MLPNCWKCTKYRECQSKVSKTSNGIITFLVFVVCNINRHWFSKEQEARGLFSQLAIRTSLLKYHHWVIFCFRVIL